MITLEKPAAALAPAAAAPECKRPVYRWTEDSRILRVCDDSGTTPSKQ